jgi:hypothetical protein
MFLRRRIGREDSQIHKWSHAELAEIQQIERRTKIVAAFAGATSGAILGLAEIWLGEGALDLAGAARGGAHQLDRRTQLVDP